MRRELAIEFSRATEAAALAGYKWLGRGDKNAADGAAVLAMRHVLNEINIRGEIVIGEGEIDEAPMLYIGERVGTGFGDDVDIAVDPIEGTRMTAMGQANAMTTLAVGEKGSFLKAPDMYMEKLIVGPKAKGVIDLNLSLGIKNNNKQNGKYTILYKLNKTPKIYITTICKLFILPCFSYLIYNINAINAKDKATTILSGDNEID